MVPAQPTPFPASGASLGSPILLLFPTELERRRFDDQGGLPRGMALQAVSGFGPVAAAARTAQLASLLKPRLVLLLGIAGTYDAQELPVGAAAEFGSVALDGVGVGEGDTFRGPPALGFPQWPGSEGTTAQPVEDRIPLSIPEANGPLLLTTCAASDGSAQAALRRKRFPDALAEDMEGFAVAMACALHRVPLRIVRGISNEVGDRDPRAWRIPAALAEARRLALDILNAPEPTAVAPPVRAAP